MNYSLGIASGTMRPVSLVIVNERLPGVVAAAAAGDTEAFRRLVDLSRNVVCSIALAAVKDVVVSEDIAQEVYLAAWKNLATLRNPSSFFPWIRQLTRNQCTEHLRRQTRREKRHLSQEQADEVLSSVVDPSGTPVDSILRDEDRRILNEAIERLVGDARETVILFYREGRSAAQVAALLERREAAVKKCLSRARATLREALLDRAGDLLQQTAPGAGFTAAVLGLVTLAAPATATATAASVGVTTALGGKSTFATFGGLLSGAALGGASAFGAIWIGIQRIIRQARDEEERIALRRFRKVVIGVLILTLIGWALASHVPGRERVHYGVSAFYALALTLLYSLWLPKITSRRKAAELREDPDAWRRHRRDRILGILGTVAGVACGGMGLYNGR